VSNGRLYRTEGIVMRRRDQGEADRVLSLCTPSGKADVLAKGVRKIRSRKAGHIELFTRASFVLSRVPNYWDIISQAETLDPHTRLRSDLLRGTYARYTIELLDRFFAAGEGGTAVFDLLDHTLNWLCEEEDLDLITRFYEQHLLGLAGFRVELFRCVGSHHQRQLLRPGEPQDSGPPFGFTPELGGALCPDCYDLRRRELHVMALSPNALRILQACQRNSYGELAARTTPNRPHEEMEQVMRCYITYHLEQDVKVGTFLQQIKRLHTSHHGSAESRGTA
jgi:DNA repair protein RecO (recombination protein O)